VVTQAENVDVSVLGVYRKSDNSTSKMCTLGVECDTLVSGHPPRTGWGL